MPRDVTGLRAGAILAAGLLGVWGGVGPVWADDARAMAYGKHLAQQCTSCHRIDGTNNGIPSIIGWEPAQFVAVLTSYRDKVRPNEVMVSMAQSLGDPEMQALAAYFGTLKASAPKAHAKKR